MILERRYAKSAICRRFAQGTQSVAGVGQPGLLTDWMRVHRHSMHHNRDSYVVVEQERPGDEATLVPDGGHRLSLPIQVFCYRFPQGLSSHLRMMLRQTRIIPVVSNLPLPATTVNEGGLALTSSQSFNRFLCNPTTSSAQES